MRFAYTDVDKGTKLWSVWIDSEKSQLSVVQEKFSRHLSGGDI